MKLRLPKHSTNLFTWDAGSKLFVAEISDIPRPVSARVYDDACDIGFILVSAKTGEEVEMFCEAETRDDEGELLYWTYRPALNDARRNLMGVRFFND